MVCVTCSRLWVDTSPPFWWLVRNWAFVLWTQGMKSLLYLQQMQWPGSQVLLCTTFFLWEEYTDPMTLCLDFSVAGTVGVAAVTAGPGVTNTVTAMKNAQMAESPVLLIGGATGTLQKVDCSSHWL